MRQKTILGSESVGFVLQHGIESEAHLDRPKSGSAAEPYRS